jgi:hypothetical protein
MRLPELLLLYALVGTGCAGALLVKQGVSRAGDAVLLAGFWPLYGPFLLVQLQEAVAAPSGEIDFLAAMKRASATPLGKLLPDEETARALARRVTIASGKIDEIESLLAKPEFSERAAAARLEELKAKGASDAALAHTAVRVQNIRRLRLLRDRFVRELDEVHELLAQLTTQAEVVRLAGVADDASRELVRELVYRVEGLDQVLDHDLQLMDA